MMIGLALSPCNATLNKGGGAVAWTPNTPEGLLAWMDPTNGLTAGPVASWNSREVSGTAYQTTGGNQPMYSATALDGSPGLTFSDATVNYLILSDVVSGTDELTVTCVCKFTGSAGLIRTVYGASSGTGLKVVRNASGYVEIQAQGSAVLATSAATVPLDAVGVLSVRAKATGPYDIRWNGVSIGSGTLAASIGALTNNLGIMGGAVGSTERMRGVISSMLVYAFNLSDDDTARAESFLLWQVNKASALDAAHLYKAAAPRYVPSPVRARLAKKSKMYAFGDSNLQGTFGRSMLDPFLDHVNAALVVPTNGNKAVAGQTVAATYAATAGMDSAAKVVLYSVGRNSIAADVSSARMKYDYLYTYRRLVQLGSSLECILQPTLLPRLVDVNWTQPFEDKRIYISDFIRSMNGRFNGRIVISDIENVGFDTTTMVQSDGQHLNELGGHCIGAALAVTANSILQAGDDFYSDPSDFASTLSNSALSGVAGAKVGTGVTGEVADGCEVRILDGLDGLTIACSKAVNERGHNVQRIVISGTNGTGGELRFTVPSVAGSYASGGQYESWCAAEVAGDNIARMFCGTFYGTDTAALTGATAAPLLYTDYMMSDFVADFALTARLANLGAATTLLHNGSQFYIGAGPVALTIDISEPTTRLMA